MSHRQKHDDGHHDVLSGIVRIFLNSNLSIILIVFSLLIGAAALFITAREEDPQIVVPLADIYVQFPGHSAAEVEQLVSAPLERMLYQIDGVEYVYSMSSDHSAIITVRFYVGQDRERSLVKLFKKLNENSDSITPGVTSWVMKPVEIDDVPIVTLAVTGAGDDGYSLRRVGEELVERLAVTKNVNRAFVIGGQSRTVSIQLDTERLRAHQMTVNEVTSAIGLSNSVVPAGNFVRDDEIVEVETNAQIARASDLLNLVVGVFNQRPVFLKDVATVVDGPEELTNYVRHGWGPARDFPQHHNSPGTIIGGHAAEAAHPHELSQASVTIAISKQKGSNAVHVADAVIAEAWRLKDEFLPDNIELVVTRNNGLTANHKVNELVEALGVAIVIVVLLLTIGMGWREAFIVAVAVPVVFGLTLAVNLMFGYTINRVTLFALILALGLLVDDPIVDVENIARHFEERKKATRKIVLDAVAEIRPPLISATLAVIVSFLPMFFITGMMGPYMSPMALNVPIAMLMSMVVAFTITPWLSYQVLKRHYPNEENATTEQLAPTQYEREHDQPGHQESYDPEVVKQSLLYRFFRPLMLPLLKNRVRAIGFLGLMAVLTAAAAGLGALRMVPLKMLPFDNKNEFLLVLDLHEGSSLEQTDAVVRQLESAIAKNPEVTDFTSYVGVSGPIDFNGMVRHYYLRNQPYQAEIRVNFVGKKNRQLQSHGLGLRMRDELTAIAEQAGGILRVVELPPGPPVLASLVAEVTGRPGSSYEEILSAASTVGQRLKKEPGVVEVDDIRQAPTRRVVFVPDQEKAALAGVSVEAIAMTIQTALGGNTQQVLRMQGERQPLRLTFRLPKSIRSSMEDLSQLPVKTTNGSLVVLAELGSWKEESVGQTIYHKNLQRIAYVFAECIGRPPADCVVDILADAGPAGVAMVADAEPRALDSRTFFSNGSGIQWRIPEGMQVTFAGEGEWKITLDVFRDLGLAFGAAMLMIYIILVAQTGSFIIPTIVMLAIPLTVLGVMPGFYLLNAIMSSPVGGYPDPVFFTATAMIGMIALSGIVTRDSIILVDFMEQAVARGRPLFDAILESRVVRLRPILLTAGAAMFSAVPITLDPIFSGLGWSLIFGLIASTLFTLFVIPVTYWLLYHKPSQ
ncbi:MAG: efflux RND transporter permease subunit [Planctomycetales bacterium]|nr:efflux RND transporter permease subunit [Planctomycetales bacterium]